MLSVALVTIPIVGQMAAARLRAITVDDCVRTRRIVDQEVQISPDGARIAYVVKSPDVHTNRNDYQLYVGAIHGSRGPGSGHLLLRADGVSSLRWLGPRRLIVRVNMKSGGRQELKTGFYILDAATGARRRLGLPSGVDQFSATANGQEFVFTAKTGEDNAPVSANPHQQESDQERGFAVRFGEGDQESFEHLPEDAVYYAKETGLGALDVKRLYFKQSWHSRRCSVLRHVLSMDLSPDGRHLLLVYSARDLPPGWANEPYVKQAHSFGTLFDTYVLGLYDMKSGELRLGFNFPAGLVRVRWSDDSRAYGVLAPSPFGTSDATAEEQEAAASGNIVTSMLQFQHVFVVDAVTGSFERVLGREVEQPGRKSADDLPLRWKQASGPMLIRVGDNTFAWMIRQDGQWKESRQFSLWKGEKFLSSLSSDGQSLAGVSQTTMLPPDIFVFDLRSQQAKFLTDLNPEYRNVRLGRVEPLEWTNQYGSRCAGFLIRPVGYEEGTRYPMVFLAAPPQDVFISDAAYTTSYAPQSLATAGFVVVMAQYPIDNRITKDRYPGEIREAYNWMSMIESAVDLLATRGMVDKTNVGIAGFSRTSWLVDFTLTHSAYTFSAASSADSGIYTYGSYFEYNSLQGMKGEESEFGGPPYGKILQYWLDYAAPFNADRVRAPLLMEYTGTDENGLEFFTALSRLGKVVEFYRYPRGAHPLDTPYERVASLQRNVDWFRFWMQRYEGASPPYDPNQYARWRRFREQQRWNDRVRADGQDPTTEFLQETAPGGLRDVAAPAPFARDFEN